MSTDMATALVVLAGVILASVLGLIGTVIVNRRTDRRERNSQAGTQIQMIGDMQQRIWWVQQQLPPGGMSSVLETVRLNTAALTDHSKSLTAHGQILAQVSETLKSVVARLDEHDETLRTLTGAQVVAAAGVVVPRPVD